MQDNVVNLTLSQKGKPYVFGSAGPNSFDCSGLVYFVYKSCGFNISRTTKTQINDGREVSRNQLQRGDLVFPNSGHVTIYIGNNRVVHAPQPGEVVKESTIWAFWRARRILPDETHQNEAAPQPPAPTQPPAPPQNPDLNIAVGHFIFQTPTSHDPVDHRTFRFLIGDYNRDGVQDLYIIKQRAAGRTEIHILSGASNYMNYLLQVRTPLHETDENWEFALGDYNGNGKLDLFCIAKNGTGSHKTEVHILDGSNEYGNFILQIPTPLEETHDNWAFTVGDYNGNRKPDLYCIKKHGTPNKKTEIHILDGANNYQNFILQIEIPIHETNENWEFGTSDYNNNGRDDLYCFAKNGTGSHSTEAHILNAQNNFQNFLQQTGTQLHETHEDFSLFPHKLRLYAIAHHGGSNKVEVHCLRI